MEKYAKTHIMENYWNEQCACCLAVEFWAREQLMGTNDDDDDNGKYSNGWIHNLKQITGIRFFAIR